MNTKLFEATRWLVVAAVVAVVAVGCGRTAMDSDCQTNAQCEEGYVCDQGSCVPVPDAGVNDVECTEDGDCGEQLCRADEEGAGCVIDVCNQQTGQCETDSCTPDCGEDEQPYGCRCMPDECDEDDECEGGICDEGSCRPCLSDAECSDDGSEICEDGLCVESPDCQDDQDCRPHEMCEDETCVLRPDCTFDEDCDEDERCVGGVCTYTPECESDEDCGEQAECVGGYCQADVCRGNDECPDDQLCDAGECIDPPVATSCEIVTDSSTITPGEQIALQAFAYDQQGNGVAAQFSWSSSDPDVASIQGDELVGEDQQGTTTVTATLAGGDPVVCDGSPTFDNPGVSQDGDLRIGVRHMDTGDPVEGAEVHVGAEFAETDSDGFVELVEPDGAYDVSVFHEDFNFMTVRGAESDDIRIPLTPRSGTGPVAGFTGEFDHSAIHTDGDVELGIAGASIAGDLLDLDLETLFGDPFYTEFEFQGMGEEVPLPGGVTAYGEMFGGKQTYYARGAEGPRLAWGISGEAPFEDLLELMMDAPDDMSSAIGAVLPLFTRFDHAQQPITLEALPRVMDVDDINNSGDTQEWLPDYQNFPEQDLTPSVRQDLTTQVDISSLPTLDGEQTEVAVLLGGTRTDGVGVVPLGISAVADETGDGQPGSETLYMAPPYGSAVGGRYNVVAITFPGGDDGDDDGPEGLSDEMSMALWNGQTLQQETSLGTFPDSSSGSVDGADRTIEVDEASAGPILRGRIVAEERTWDVWTTGQQEGPGQYSGTIEVPDAPGGWSDVFGDREEVFVDTINTSVPIDDLVRVGAVGMNRAGLVTTSFNRTGYH